MHLEAHVSPGRLLVAGALHWLRSTAPWYAASAGAHLMALIVLALVLGTVQAVVPQPGIVIVPPDDLTKIGPDDKPPVTVLPPLPPIDDPLPPPIVPPDPTILTFGQELPDPTNVPPSGGNGSIGMDPIGGGEPFGGVVGKLPDFVAGGPRIVPGSIPGNGGSGQAQLPGGIGDRISKVDQPPDGTRETVAAVNRAMNWLARHQRPDGGWSLDKYTAVCKDDSCTSAGRVNSDIAGTALGLLPFLAAGQTHQTKGEKAIYRKTVYNGLSWLVKQQKADGGLTTGGGNMYGHGLASICLSEAYGLTKEKWLGESAQAAVAFIERAQNAEDGGWRYAPGQPGDTSVVGWQVMALKSAEMAGLKVDRQVLARARQFVLAAGGKSAKGGLFGYLPGGAPGLGTTSVGLLCSQYLGLKRDDPAMNEGLSYLMRNMPRKDRGRNIYYAYYATQVMHNLPGREWDSWNRNMRRILVESQVRDGCAAGSWDPLKPAADAWGPEGGRLMMTSLSALTLEVYYRYLPLYKVGSQTAPGRATEDAGQTAPAMVE